MKKMIKVVCLSLLLTVVTGNNVLAKSQKDTKQARYVHDNVLREQFLNICAKQIVFVQNDCLKLYVDTVKADTVSRKVIAYND